MSKHIFRPKRLKLGKIFNLMPIARVVTAIVLVLIFSLVFVSQAQATTLYERYITEDDVAFAVFGPNWKGQTFTIGNTGTNENHNIVSVKLKLSRLGSPGIVTISIRNTSGGLPTGGDLTSGTIDGDTLLTSGTWYEISLTPHELLASAQYAIVAKAPSGDGSNLLMWHADKSSPSYFGGACVMSGDEGSSWTEYIDYDFLFEEYGIVLGDGEAVPEFTTFTFIIAAVAGFGIYFVIRKRKEKKAKV